MKNSPSLSNFFGFQLFEKFSPISTKICKRHIFSHLIGYLNLTWNQIRLHVKTSKVNTKVLNFYLPANIKNSTLSQSSGAILSHSLNFKLPLKCLHSQDCPILRMNLNLCFNISHLIVRHKFSKFKYYPPNWLTHLVASIHIRQLLKMIIKTWTLKSAALIDFKEFVNQLGITHHHLIILLTFSYQSSQK